MSDEVLKVVEDLQSDGELTSLSEADISLSVVLRVLGTLNWNIHNHREVSSQHSVEKKSVDLALLTGNTTTVFIEVKKGGEPLRKHEKQLLDYTFTHGVKIAILTNGTIWWFYLPLREGSWKERKFDIVELDKQDKEKITQKLVDFLSKENVNSGKAVQNAEDLYKKRQISATLPEAWNQLVGEPEGLVIDLLVEKTGELCGHKPEEREVEQFLLAHLQDIKITKSPDPVPPKPVPPKPKPSGSMKGTKPTAFTFNGTKYDEIKSWSSMLVRLCEVVHNEQKSRFEEVLSSTNFKRGKRPDFSRRKSDFIDAKEISRTGIFVNTNKSADQIMQTAENLVFHFYDKNTLCVDAQ